ncbi:MAG: hypothetical protein QNK37_37770 [Acidobacteriota bacterium]|nr:hypothetical protein [Acidobacteriota bacterium]
MLVQLTPAAVCEEHGLLQLLAADSKWTRHQLRELHALFDFKSQERVFAEILLQRKQHYWLFRCNQQQFCGDFVVVDMSCPQAEKRRIFVIEMKENAPLKIDAGAGIQLRNAGLCVETVAAMTGAVPADAPFETLVGDMEQLLAYLGLDEWDQPEAMSTSADSLSG